MSSSTFKRSLLAAVSIALAGCATTPAANHETGLSLSEKADAKSIPDEMVSRALDLQPALDLEGAIKQAQVQRNMGDLVSATRTLAQLVLVAPDDPRVLGEYGKTLVAQGRSDDALAFLERAIELQPADWSLFSAQGVAWDQKGEYAKAQASYNRALLLNPGEPSVLSNAALSHMQSGDLDGAEQLLLQAAQTDGNNPRISSNLALVQRLKAARAPARSQSDNSLAAAPAPAPEPTPVPEAAPAPEPMPAPEPPVATVDKPVETTTLPTPEPEAVEPVQTAVKMPMPAPAPSSRLEALKADPTVRMQAVPRDSHAGPVAVRKPAPAKKEIATKVEAPEVATEKASAKTDVSLLRPSLDGAQQASAGK